MKLFKRKDMKNSELFDTLKDREQQLNNQVYQIIQKLKEAQIEIAKDLVANLVKHHNNLLEPIYSLREIEEIIIQTEKLAIYINSQEMSKEQR